LGEGYETRNQLEIILTIARCSGFAHRRISNFVSQFV